MTLQWNKNYLKTESNHAMIWWMVRNLICTLLNSIKNIDLGQSYICDSIRPANFLQRNNRGKMDFEI